MLSLTRWSPLAEMNNLHRDLERAFGLSWDHFPAERDRAWVPATEVTSDNGGWKMRMALPGIDPKDVQVDLHRDVLTITGERNLQRAEQTEQHLSEFGYGRFERSFTLPDHVDTERVSAAFEHGMLEITLPMAEAGKPRRIEISGAAAPTTA